VHCSGKRSGNSRLLGIILRRCCIMLVHADHCLAYPTDRPALRASGLHKRCTPGVTVRDCCVFYREPREIRRPAVPNGAARLPRSDMFVGVLARHRSVESTDRYLQTTRSCGAGEDEFCRRLRGVARPFCSVIAYLRFFGLSVRALIYCSVRRRESAAPVRLSHLAPYQVRSTLLRRTDSGRSRQSLITRPTAAADEHCIPDHPRHSSSGRKSRSLPPMTGDRILVALAH